MSTLHTEPMPHPLRVDESGAVRVGRTRVLLEIVVTAYQMGDSPEQIARNFPTLQLADVYAVLAYYLTYREAVDAFLEERASEAADSRRMIEAQPEYQAFRERMQAKIKAARQ